MCLSIVPSQGVLDVGLRLRQLVERLLGDLELALRLSAGLKERELAAYSLSISAAYQPKIRYVQPLSIGSD